MKLWIWQKSTLTKNNIAPRLLNSYDDAEIPKPQVILKESDDLEHLKSGSLEKIKQFNIGCAAEDIATVQ